MDESEVLGKFVEESREQFRDIETQLLQIKALGANSNDALVNTVFRAIRPIKGAATNFLGLTQINAIAIRLENMLGRIREHQFVLDAHNVDLMIKAANRLRWLVDSIAISNESDNCELIAKLDALLDNDSAFLRKQASATHPHECGQSVADESQIADNSFDDEVVVASADAKTRDTKTPQMPRQTTSQCGSTKTPAPKGASTRRSLNSGHKNLAGVDDLSLRISNGLDEIADGLDQVTIELQEAIMQTRKQPIGNLFNRFPRVIRELARSLGKQITLQMDGNEVAVDRAIVEAITTPLTHLICNSCDHGIETPEVRQASGKRKCGRVLLRAFHQAGKVMIEIADDGAGIDPNRMRQKAVEKGLYSQAAADQMSDRDAVNLIFAFGFTSATVVTAICERGFGMDVVRTHIEKLGGTVEVTSVLGRGSNFSIALPPTSSIA